MAGETSSPYMNLPIPGVGVTAGPTYATDVNNSLTIIDGHSHVAGSGVQITPAAININSNLTMNSFNLTSIGALTLSPNANTPANGSLYESGVDLYYIDGSGNVIRITQSGSVTGSAGTITGLPSGTASASFGSATFTFQSATNTAANIDGGAFIFRNTSPNSTYGVTLSAPSALASNYSLTLPILPAQTNVMTLDTSGNMGSTTWNDIANNRTRSTGTTVAVGGVAISASCGVFDTSSTTLTAVTNLAVTLTTSGRPIHVVLSANGTEGAPSNINTSDTTAEIALFRGATNIATWIIAAAAIFDTGPGTLVIDPQTAGTYTYTLKAKVFNGAKIVEVAYYNLVAYEL